MKPFIFQLIFLLLSRVSQVALVVRTHLPMQET